VGSLANGIRADAVCAALTVSWSNGRTERNVNQLKCLKRQMNGRGKPDLLHLRLIAPDTGAIPNHQDAERAYILPLLTHARVRSEGETLDSAVGPHADHAR
jgi:hypothetical protein